MLCIFGVFVLGLISSSLGIPFPEGSPRSVDTSFIGKGTNDIATALFKGYVKKEENMVYSPFGYSAILAVFSEGARGVSREEIVNYLRFPSDVTAVREAYRSVLERFAGSKFPNSPEFQNWFYIYKNYTVEEELQNVLRKYYLTDVRVVERPEDYIQNTRKSPIKEPMKEAPAMEMSKIEAQQPVPQDQAKAEEEVNNAIKEVFNVESSETPKEDVKPIEKSVTPSEGDSGTIENSKFKGQEDIAKFEDVKNEGEKMLPVEEKKMAPIKTNAEMGAMPTDNFSGITDSSLCIRGEESKPRMVIFNGLYYKGKWQTHFVKKPADDSRAFYKSENEKVFVSTIHSQGVFNYGNIPNLDARAIELPYKGGRYSLLVLVPNTRNGLPKLISDLSEYPLRNVYDQLTEKLVEVCLPSFEINTISKPVSTNNKLILSKVPSIFKPETADLSGISSKDSGLYVEELVQVVTFKVDADYTKANFLTASIASSRSNIQNFQVNQPFLFYLRDNLEDIIIVNGKVVDPTPKSSLYFS